MTDDTTRKVDDATSAFTQLANRESGPVARITLSRPKVADELARDFWAS
jgi:hypothetical protein